MYPVEVLAQQRPSTTEPRRRSTALGTAPSQRADDLGPRPDSCPPLHSGLQRGLGPTSAAAAADEQRVQFRDEGSGAARASHVAEYPADLRCGTPSEPLSIAPQPSDVLPWAPPIPSVARLGPSARMTVHRSRHRTPHERTMPLVRTRARAQTGVRTYTLVCGHARTHTCTCVCTSTRTHARTRKYAHKHTCARTLMHVALPGRPRRVVIHVGALRRRELERRRAGGADGQGRAEEIGSVRRVRTPRLLRAVPHVGARG